MKINITKKQYYTLAKAVYLGNWMANAHRSGEDNPRIKEYNEICDYVFSLASDFGYEDNLEFQIENDQDEKNTTRINKIKNEYDEDSFWDELTNRMGDRDFYRKYSEEERKKMDQTEHFENMYISIDLWDDELTEYGIERLEIVKK